MDTISKVYADRAVRAMVPSSVADGKERLVIERGSGVLVYDVEGKEYIDFMAGPGILATGHCHPEVVAAGQEQLAKLTQTPGITINRHAIALAEKIAEVAPPGLQRTFFCNSGAEANEGALKLAFKYASAHKKTGSKVICLEHAFHGRLALSMSLTDFDQWKVGLEAFACFPGVIRVPAPYCYRSPFDDERECVNTCVEAIQSAIRQHGAENIAALILEPVLGVGGVIFAPRAYYQQVAELCRRHKITLIFDEVFTGFGRTGRWFASEHFGVVPDIMAIAKTMGGGIPLGGFVATEERASAFAPADHNTTFGAHNVLSLVMGLKVLDIIQRDRLVENARIRGEQLVQALRVEMERSPIIGDVRGLGLFIGVEIVEDKLRKTPGVELARKIRQSLEDLGVIVGTGGKVPNVIRLSPPLIIGEDHVDRFMTAFGQAIRMTMHDR